MRRILWVNEMEQKLVGRTYNIETFNKNTAIMKCSKEVKDALIGLKEGEGTLVFKVVGRYLCFIEVNYDETLRKMVFVDFQKNDKLAIAAFSTTHKPTDKNAKEVTEIFFQALNLYNESYDKHYNDVELRLDKIVLN
ncbi:hypothetical protein A3860_39485 [Niastella vici]|uniref:Uncharacterized protein n=1 Tax=Niastella vici TaxID=1703345 RepID=A0A1V9FKF6_9BACT|nr:hypothetical protein [Niastella vici]OQP58706.1 hypothetical protein A3860_39485 [Niastella vici]